MATCTQGGPLDYPPYDFHCSECKNLFPFRDGWPNYCPRCGAGFDRLILGPEGKEIICTKDGWPEQVTQRIEKVDRNSKLKH